MAESEPLSICVEHRGEIALVTVGGEVDFKTGPALKKTIDNVIGPAPTKLIIDLSEVTFMSSVGLAILAWTSERLGESAGFAVVATRLATMRPIHLTGLDQLFSLCSTIDQALISVNNR